MTLALRAARRRQSGLTLIEVLVTILILVILMAIALPLYLSAVADTQYKVCRSNMQTIANAVVAARVKTESQDYSTWIGSTVADLISQNKLQDLQISPTCPNGAYFAIYQGHTIDNTTFQVKCCPLHGTYEPGVNSN
ncbi:MAG TPA: prepilin-type N-terminal cleavage/methylation domain-containing protein [Chthonomonadaceae bacterium]|nr:prepilin-type N-terminal cleavage/methylation domain-containing protein [Chthonomonadaceae bacterium]